MRTDILLLVALAIACVSASSLQARLSVPSAHKFGHALPATVTLFNPNPFPVTVLPWRTPLEGFHHDMFTLRNRDSGEHAVYVGRLLKRVEPSADDFITVEAGAAHRFMVDLTEHYFFMETGVYEVSLSTPLEVLSENGVVTEVLQSEAQHLFVAAVQPELLNADYIEPNAIHYNGCSTSQQSTISSALSIAKSDAQQAYQYLLTGSCTGDYQTFFGTVTSTRYNTVFSHFDSIVSALNSNNFGFDCSTCNMPGTYAYVYPTDPTKTIYLCNVFWRAASGSHQYDSQPGTITHEMSHFKAVAGTDDIQYGVSGCKTLAQTNPNSAIKNADSHEFFQEMNPSC